MRLNPYVVTMVTLCMILTCLFIAGCRNSKPSRVEAPPKETATVGEGRPAVVDPFQRLAAATSGTLSAASAEKVNQLHISGVALLGICAAVWYVSRSWQTIAMVFVLGISSGACAVLLTDYPKVVLLIPLCVLAVLVAYGIQIIIEWWTGYRAWKAASTEIELADTGEKSLGQRIKDRFAAAGLTPILNKGLKVMEKIWAKQSS